MEVVEVLQLPLCAHHAKKAFSRLSAYYGAKVIAKKLLEPEIPREPRSWDTQPGYVYIIRHGTRVKIGYTTNFKARMKQLPHDEVLALTRGTLKTEASFHAMFKDIRVHGEWFEATDQILDFARSLGVAEVKAA